MQQGSRQLWSLPVVLPAQRTAGKHDGGGALAQRPGTCPNTAQRDRVIFEARPWAQGHTQASALAPSSPAGSSPSPHLPAAPRRTLAPCPRPSGLLRCCSYLFSLPPSLPFSVPTPFYGTCGVQPGTNPPARHRRCVCPWGPGEPEVEDFTGRTVIYHFLGF